MTQQLLEKYVLFVWQTGWALTR